MNRSNNSQSLRGFIALCLALLQLLGVLHFALVPHAFSAGDGRVVHVHAARAQSPGLARSEGKRAALRPGVPTCAPDVCPLGNAPSSTAARIALALSGTLSFGPARLLDGEDARGRRALRVLLTAPKTSPPV